MSLEVRFELYSKYSVFMTTLPQISEFIMCSFVQQTRSINYDMDI